MKIVPIGMKAANEYVAAHHRHHKPVRGCKFCISVENEDGECCGVAICGKPVSRYLDNGTTLEINRLCTNGTRNVCSMLYGVCTSRQSVRLQESSNIHIGFGNRRKSESE